MAKRQQGGPWRHVSGWLRRAACNAPATAANLAKTLGKTAKGGKPRATHRRSVGPIKLEFACRPS
ncbi:hypothetical protein BEL01nite_83040 [Bradyrhizobium elkanii]|nr:hypothetical protein BEL01nite_83040 [Bradyrhizobium elkanii]